MQQRWNPVTNLMEEFVESKILNGDSNIKPAGLFKVKDSVTKDADYVDKYAVSEAMKTVKRSVEYDVSSIKSVVKSKIAAASNGNVKLNAESMSSYKAYGSDLDKANSKFLGKLESELTSSFTRSLSSDAETNGFKITANSYREDIARYEKELNNKARSEQSKERVRKQLETLKRKLAELESARGGKDAGPTPINYRIEGIGYKGGSQVKIKVFNDYFDKQYSAVYDPTTKKFNEGFGSETSQVLAALNKLNLKPDAIKSGYKKTFKNYGSGKNMDADYSEKLSNLRERKDPEGLVKDSIYHKDDDIKRLNGAADRAQAAGKLMDAKLIKAFVTKLKNTPVGLIPSAIESNAISRWLGAQVKDAGLEVYNPVTMLMERVVVKATDSDVESYIKKLEASGTKMIADLKEKEKQYNSVKNQEDFQKINAQKSAGFFDSDFVNHADKVKSGGIHYSILDKLEASGIKAKSKKAVEMITNLNNIATKYNALKAKNDKKFAKLYADYRNLRQSD